MEFKLKQMKSACSADPTFVSEKILVPVLVYNSYKINEAHCSLQ